ncbi:TIGR03756 family integrating conjugative element protein [Halomonas sabkhae]|uniref:TIGR03756 family integrating conjugative element protein n=1 Tax=Halomonas sabkhae TaxID=626223 RepID=UPI0025B32046|nr:TIGR03756 family integrating conjugative element protein [Halomonas sabkhae]MDN3525301.1 TIGR03756 family integrating conjugative element protein [Halomonas sabkhae]
MNLTQRLQGAGLATLLALVLSVSGVANQPVQAAEISTPEIAESALSSSCLDYRVIGICVWITCTAVGCYTETSIKVTHYVPELVVSAYQEVGKNPWRGARGIVSTASELDLVSDAIGSATNSLFEGVSGEVADDVPRGGGTSTERHSNNHQTVRFKNADAVGHPALAAFDNLRGFMCRSGATPLVPYYVSEADSTAWRANIPEMSYPQALVPGVRELGQAGDVWGNVFPRSGFVTQTNDYKAGALAAQRVADFVTKPGQPHVYLPMRPPRGAGYWPPKPIREGEASTHRWQPLAPQREDSCAVWPDRGPMATYRDRRDGSGDYVWALWRPITCCERRGARLLYHTGGKGWVE